MSAPAVSDGVRSRPAAARSRSDVGGILAVEAFSRGDAFDRAWMGWGALRVLSRQDWRPGAVRDEGRVANMERLLLVLEGALDADCGALGRRRVDAGAALWLHCGHGVEVRLANASGTRPLHLLECWLQPGRVNASPAVEVVAACVHAGTGPGASWRTLVPADPDPGPGPGRAGTARAAASAAEAVEAGSRKVAMSGSGRFLATATIDAGAVLALPPTSDGRCWLEVVDGEAMAGEQGRLGPGDGLAWMAGAAGAPGRIAACGARPVRVLLVALTE